MITEKNKTRRCCENATGVFTLLILRVVVLSVVFSTFGLLARPAGAMSPVTVTGNVNPPLDAIDTEFSKLVPALLEAIKRQQTENAALRDRTAKMEATIDSLQHDLTGMKGYTGYSNRRPGLDFWMIAALFAALFLIGVGLRRRRLLLALAALALLVPASPAEAQKISGNFAKGSVLAGYDSSTCNSAWQGAIRFSSATTLLQYCNASAWTTLLGAGSAIAWSALTNPTANLGLTMGAYTSTFTYNGATGANANLFKLIDTASNTGTGYLLDVETATGSALNPLHLKAKNTTDLVFTSAGRLGVGTAAPTELLAVEGSANGKITSEVTNSNAGTAAFAELAARNSTAAGDAIRILALGTAFTSSGANQQDGGVVGTAAGLSGGLSIVTVASAPIRFYTAGAADANERMRIFASGGVNIGGTTDPGAGSLLVTGNLQTNGVPYFVYHANIPAQNGIALGTVGKATAPSGYQGTIGIYSNDAVANQLQGSMALMTDPTAANRRLAIGVIEQGTAWRNVTLAESGGNVGIGTPSPGVLLDVSKSQDAATYLNVTNANAGVSSQVVIGGISDASIIELRTHALARTVARYGIPVGGYSELVARSGNGLLIGTSTDAKPIVFGTNGAERMRIDSAGNVGIGDTTPDGVLKLDVEGPVGATQYCDNNGANCFTPGLPATAAGSTKQVQFNSGGSFGASANFNWDIANSRLGIGTAVPAYPLEVMDATGNGIAAHRNANTVGWGSGINYTLNNASGAQVIYGRTAGVIIANTAGAENGATSIQAISAGANAEIARFYNNGGMSLSPSYAATTPPSNGAIIQGNVGIGTTNPTTQNGSVSKIVALSGADNLDINAIITGTTSTGLLLETTFTGQSSGTTRGSQISMQRDSTSTLTALSTNIQFTTTNAGTMAEKMRITPAGYVGIGTTAPIAPLQVKSNGATNAYFTTTDFNAGTNTGSIFEISQGAGTGNTYSQIKALSSGYSAWNNLVLQAGGGKVGIGDASPDGVLLLDVEGAVGATQYCDNNGANCFTPGSTGLPAGANTQVQFNNNGAFGADANFIWDNTNKRIGIGTAAPLSALNVRAANTAFKGQLSLTDPNNLGSSTSAVVAITGYGSDNAAGNATGRRWYLGNATGTDNDTWLMNSQNANLILATNGSEKMRIAAGVNIGGTTDPGAGSLFLTAPDEGGLSIRQSNGPTYGFDFALDQGVDGALHINRVVAGTPTNLMTFSRVSGGVNIGGTSDPGAGNLRVDNGHLFVRPSSGTDTLLRVRNAVSLAGSVLLSAENNAGSVNTPLEIRSSVTDFSAGNVGIGYTGAWQALTVNGNIAVGNHDTAGLRFVGQTVNGAFDAGNGTGMEIENVAVGGNYSQNVYFRTHHYGVSQGRRMKIDYDGKVGIGTDTPGQLLTASGTTGQPATSGATQNGVLRIQVPGVPDYGEALDIGMHVGLSGPPSYAWLQSANKGALNFNYNLALNPNGGAVTIGTATPGSGMLLTVNGSVGATQYCNTSGANCIVPGSITPTPAGANTQVQFNNSGVMGASANFTWNGTSVTTNGIFTANAPDEGGLSIRQNNAPTYGFDFSLDNAVDGALHINRVVAGTPTNLMTFSRTSGGVTIGGTNDPGGGRLYIKSADNGGAPDYLQIFALNLTQGIGIGYNQITGIGSNANQDINLNAKGTGNVIVNRNIGLGGAPHVWGSGLAIEYGAGQYGSLWFNTGSDTHWNSNAYWDGAWKYATNGVASNAYLYNGEFHIRTAGSGTANAALTWGERLMVTNSGNVSVGGTHSGDGPRIFEVKVGADDRLSIATPYSLGTGTRIEAYNNAVSLNRPMELRASQFVISGGGVNIGATTNPGAGNLSTAGTIAFTNLLYGNGKAVFNTQDTYLRLNQGSESSSGIWLGSSRLMLGGNEFAVGSNGNTSDARIRMFGTWSGTNTITLNGDAGTISAAGTVSGSNVPSGGYWDAPNFTTWPSDKFGAIGWYNVGAGPAGSSFYTGYRSRMADGAYGNEVAIPHIADRFFYRRYANGYGSWQELANLSGATFTGSISAPGVNVTAGNNYNHQGASVLRLSDNSNTVVNPPVAGGMVYLNWDRGSGIVFGNGSGGQTGRFYNSGGLTVGGGSDPGAGNFVISRHIGSAGGAPTVAGQNSYAVSVAANSTDLAGKINVTAPASPCGNCYIVNVTFANAFTNAPFIVLTGAAVATVYYTVVAVSTSGFSVGINPAPPGTSNVSFNYMVMGR